MSNMSPATRYQGRAEPGGPESGPLPADEPEAAPASCPPATAHSRTAPGPGVLGMQVSSIAHDLNDLLTTILGNASLALADAPAAAEQVAALARVEDACLRAKELARRLLALSRDQGGAERVEATGDAAWPSAQEQASLTAEARNSSRPVSGQGRSRSGRILLLEDDEAVLQVSARMLERLGYQVETARTGEEAVAQYQAAMAAGAPFTAVLLDLVVAGGMGGRETLERLKEIDPPVRAVVVSGYSDDPVMSQYARHGFGAMISKPYRLADLEAALHAVIEP
jgi:CheY-like chemotaxis protein